MGFKNKLITKEHLRDMIAKDKTERMISTFKTTPST
jgi:hypothetical protein